VLTRGEKVCAFIEKFCIVPEGKQVGQPLRLLPFQRRFILDVYDNPSRTRRAYLSVARKNGKSGLIAAILLAHIVGPEARLNSQIISGARSREQAGLVFKLAEKMVRQSAELSRLVRIIPSHKSIIGLARNVEYKAISAEAGTAHGLSPVLAILDEVGQIKGPVDSFVEAIETAQGAHDDPLLIAISTQAETDADLFSRWLDDAATGEDPQIVSHLYTAPEGCDLLDKDAWKAANPAMGEFRSVDDLESFANQARRLPSKENSFRWLYLNQRISAVASFLSESVWKSCAGPVADFEGLEVFAGLDLAKAAGDMTALVCVAEHQGKMHVKPFFWLPGANLEEKARADRAPYDLWNRQGYLETMPGASADYDYIAQRIAELVEAFGIKRIAYDPYNWSHMRVSLVRAGFDDSDLPSLGQTTAEGALFQPFRQGFISMSPALAALESKALNGQLAHGAHPVLETNAVSAKVEIDAAGNRKLSKKKSHGRIDGMVALAMAAAVAVTEDTSPKPSVYETRGVMVF
jgi:phage terminase large subunit-like protein